MRIHTLNENLFCSALYLLAALSLLPSQRVRSSGSGRRVCPPATPFLFGRR